MEARSNLKTDTPIASDRPHPTAKKPWRQSGRAARVWPLQPSLSQNEGILETRHSKLGQNWFDWGKFAFPFGFPSKTIQKAPLSQDRPKCPCAFGAPIQQRKRGPQFPRCEGHRGDPCMDGKVQEEAPNTDLPWRSLEKQLNNHGVPGILNKTHPDVAARLSWRRQGKNKVVANKIEVCVCVPSGGCPCLGQWKRASNLNTPCMDMNGLFLHFARETIPPIF